jgi:hypothetical protein
LTELRIDLVLALRSSATSPDAIALRSIDLLTRHVRLFGKFFRRLQQLAILPFVALPTCSDLVLYYWSKVVQATNGPPDMIAGVYQLYESRLPAITDARYADRLEQCGLPCPVPGTSYGPFQRESGAVESNAEERYSK